MVLNFRRGFLYLKKKKNYRLIKEIFKLEKKLQFLLKIVLYRIRYKAKIGMQEIMEKFK